MKNDATLILAEQFSRYPAGRQKSDGPNSGERFRIEFLKPILESKQLTTIHFDGARGYGSSFLEEAFGGLIRDGYSLNDINSYLKFKSTDSSVISEISAYLNSADENCQKD